MKRLLFIFAHPDDESFMTGGTIAKYADEGEVDIHLLCVTRGEAGSTGEPPQCLPEELGDVRERELKRAAKHLGIHHIHFDNCGDGKLQDVGLDKLKQIILTCIDKIKPHVIVTFGPHGTSGHRDHIALQQATLKATLQTEEISLQKLYYTTIPDTLTGRFLPGSYTDPDDSITTIIDCGEFKSQVAKALKEYKTQNKSIQVCFPEIYNDKLFSIRDQEHYILAWSKEPIALTEKENDLFYSVRI